MKCLNSILIQKFSNLNTKSTLQNHQKLEFLNKFYYKNQLQFIEPSKHFLYNRKMSTTAANLIEEGKKAAAYRAIDENINAVKRERILFASVLEINIFIF